MGDKSFTLFEINLHEPSFSTSGSIPDSARQLAEDAVETDEDGIFESIDVMDGDAEEGEDAVDEDVDDDIEADEDAESSGRGMGSTVVGLLLLAALAVAKKVLSGDDIDELAELDDLTDISVDDAEEAVEEVEETEESEDTDTEAETDGDDAESSGRSKTGVLVALVLLGALIVAKKAMSGDGGLPELDDLSGEDDDEEGDHDAALDTDGNDEAATSIVDDADDEDGDHDAALDDDEDEE